MSSTLPLWRRLHRLVPATVIVLGLLLVSVVMIQQAAAQDSDSLKPPFKLNRTSSPSSPDLPRPVALPLSAPIIMSQTFNSTYNPTTTLNAVGWRELFASGATNQYTWRYAGTVPFTDTVWCAGRWPAAQPPLYPATDNYTKGMQALLIYGPLNLTEYTQLVMTGTYWLDTPPGNVLDDYFGVAYSTDGTTFNDVYAHSTANSSLSQKNTFFADLTPAARKPVVWVALTFVSNDDNLVGRGAFVKDVVLRATPTVKIYMPLVRRDPTPQATYLYSYTFGSGLNTDPQFLEWGGKVVDSDCFSTNAGGCHWGQDVVTSGHPDGAMIMYQTGLSSIAGASPNNLAPADFELSADFYVVQGKSNARLGLVFDASNGAFGRSDGTPYFDPNRNLYKFDLQFNENDNTVMSYYRLQMCVTDINNCTLVADKLPLPAGLVGNTGTWNTITIQRRGSNIKVYVNGTRLVDKDDSTYVGSHKYGVFLQTTDHNSVSNPIKIRFDNVRVRSLP